MVIKQTSIVDVSVVEDFTAAISSSSIKPSGQSDVLSAFGTAARDEKSSEPLDPTDSPFMFSASMAPPTQAGQKEDLITTVAPTIKEDHDDLPDLDIDAFASKNLTSVAPVPQHSDTFPDSQKVGASAAVTEPGPTEEQDDLSVIEINTIQPDVPMLDPSLITEPLFAEGKTEETILIPGITTATSSDLTDNPKETTEVNTEDVFSSSESMPTNVYDFGVDEIKIDYGVGALLPTQPLEQDFISTTDSINIDMTSVTLPITTYTEPTQPPELIGTTTQTPHHAQNVQTAAVAAILPDSEELTDDVTLSTGVQVFDESIAQLTEHSSSTLMETDVATEIDPEFFTSSTITTPASYTTKSPTAAPTHADRTEPSSQPIIAAHLQHASKTETWSLIRLCGVELI